MSVINIPYYAPDSASTNSKYSKVVENLFPALDGYISIPSFKTFGDPIKAKIYGGISVQSMDRLSYCFIGTAKDILMLDNTTKKWRKVTNKTKKYSANELSYWSFTVFGDYVIAVNANDKPQVFNLKTDSHFRDLGGNPPKARSVTVWGDFLVLISLIDEPNKIMWSGLNNIEWWEVGKKNCDYQSFPTGGMVIGASNSTNPIIFMQRAIYRGIFAPGSKMVFTFSKLYDLADNQSARAIVARENLSFFIDTSGFYQIDIQGNLKSIGRGKINDFILKEVLGGNLFNVIGAIDPVASRVYWGIKSGNSTFINKILIYDWILDRWSYMKVELEYILPLYSTGKTLESLDEYGNLENLPYSLDSYVWQHDYPSFAGINLQGQIGSFSDRQQPMEALIVSSDFKNNNGAIGILKDIALDIDGGEYFVSFGTRKNLLSPIEWSKEYAVEPKINKINKLKRGRYLSIKIRISSQKSAWSKISKIYYKWLTAGTR
ncbi:hypothetical protein [Bartonella sp. DGB1]|uniref:hypothetical protein n=1 Tax=Bartonella sp. DGB1 TaxID=3239807 RepID=UPI0035237550